MEATALKRGEARARRAGFTALLSSVVPGLGHLMLGRRRAGLALILLDAGIAICLLGLWLWAPSTVLEAMVTPWALSVVMLLNAAVFVYRAVTTVDAFVRARAPVATDWIGMIVAAGLLLLPHLWMAGITTTHRDLLTTVFAGSELRLPTTTTPPTTVSPTTTLTTVDDTPATIVRPTTTTTLPPRIWDGYERLNVLLLGSDAGVGRTGTRTDTMVLVSIDPETGDVAMFSIPRNLTEAPLPDGMGIWDCDCFPDILTHLWANAEWYPDAFPGPQDPPVNALKAAVGMIFDVDVHFYAKVDLEGLVGIIDALGGVTIDVPETIVDESYPHELGGTEYVVIRQGVQHLDGHLALAYSRIRRHSGDFARMHRQRCVLGALAEQSGAFELLMNYEGLAGAVAAHVATDIPLDRLGDLVELVPMIDLDRVGTLRITAYNYGASGHAGYQLYDLDMIREDAHILMADPTIPLGTQDAEGFEATCDLSFD